MDSRMKSLQELFDNYFGGFYNEKDDNDFKLNLFSFFFPEILSQSKKNNN